LKKTIPNWNRIFGPKAQNTFEEEWIRVRLLGEPLCLKYSWAVPDQRALSILAKFSPLVEIGAGKVNVTALPELSIELLGINF